VRFTDEALGRFVARLRRDGLLDRTILIAFGDHWGVSRANSNVGDYLGIPHGATPRFFLEERRVPMLVRIPGAPAGRVGRATGQIDLAPTIAGLLGVDTPTAMFLGRDLLDERPRVVVFPNGAALDDERLYLSGDAGAGVEGCYRLPGLEREALTACRALKAEAERELRVGWSLLATDQVARAGDARANGAAAATP
jgi:lipoteichoic acid synthase